MEGNARKNTKQRNLSYPKLIKIYANMQGKTLSSFKRSLWESRKIISLFYSRALHFSRNEQAKNDVRRTYDYGNEHDSRVKRKKLFSNMMLMRIYEIVFRFSRTIVFGRKNKFSFQQKQFEHLFNHEMLIMFFCVNFCRFQYLNS